MITGLSKFVPLGAVAGKFAPLGAVAIAALIAATPQRAEALQFTYDGKKNGFAQINYTRDNSLTGTEVSRNSSPGVFSMKNVGGGASVDGDDPSGVGDFLAWCFDVDKTISQGPTLTYTLNSGMLDNNPPYFPGAQDRIQKLFDKSYSLTAGSGVLSSAAKSAGFQIAIWEVLYDDADTNGDYDLGSGAFTVNTGDSAVVAAANTFLDGTANFAGPKAWDIALYESTDSQNLGVASAIPLPAAAWLLLGVSGALVAAKRRSSRKAD